MGWGPRVRRRSYQGMVDRDIGKGWMVLDERRSYLIRISEKRLCM